MHYQLDAYNLCELTEEGMCEKLVTIGDTIRDDLTGKNCKILQIFHDDNGNVGFKIESDHFEGLRHPWELS